MSVNDTKCDAFLIITTIEQPGKQQMRKVKTIGLLEVGDWS